MLHPKTMASMQACCFLYESCGLCRSKRDVAFAWEKDAKKATSSYAKDDDDQTNT